ncbi:MAG: hypothetical protein U0414_05800 [Polyangiaceae bacterium]
MSKFADLLKEKKLDPRRILAASKKLESLRVEDRKIRLARAKAKKSEDKKDAKPTEKPRSGRPITPRGIAAALAGNPLSGPQKTRLLRAVNAILEQKKQPAIELKALF